MGKICEWIKSWFGKSKTVFDELEDYKAKFSNPSTTSTADKGVKVFLASYLKWRGARYGYERICKRSVGIL